ncbi:MAG: GNAT family N-acetyltransferase [Chloroflexota bacterium]
MKVHGRDAAILFDPYPPAAQVENDLLFIKEELRGCGYGHRLLEMAEKEARNRGAKHVFLDTFSFQAPGFYTQHGYQVFGELTDFPPGHRRYFLTNTCRKQGT